MELLARLRTRLGEDAQDASDALLEELLLSAKEIFLLLRYSVSPAPEGQIEPRWNGWIVSAAVELYNRIGVEGQTGHSENGINRSYDAGDLSVGLCEKVTPVVGIARG